MRQFTDDGLLRNGPAAPEHGKTTSQEVAPASEAKVLDERIVAQLNRLLATRLADVPLQSPILGMTFDQYCRELDDPEQE
jgi:hypothetical protein